VSDFENKARHIHILRARVASIFCKSRNPPNKALQHLPTAERKRRQADLHQQAGVLGVLSGHRLLRLRPPGNLDQILHRTLPGASLLPLHVPPQDPHLAVRLLLLFHRLD